MKDTEILTCTSCGYARPGKDGLCAKCEKQLGDGKGGADWSHREPSRVQSLHRDSPIVLNGEVHYQQEQGPHCKGARYRSDPGHHTVRRELSEREAGEIVAQREARRLAAASTLEDGFTEEQLQVLHLRDVERLSRADMAKVLGITEQAVKERLKRADAAARATKQERGR